MITRTCVLPLLSWIGDWGAIQVKRYYWLVVAEVYGEVSVERQTNQCSWVIPCQITQNQKNFPGDHLRF